MDNIDDLPPHDAECECGLLSCLVQNPAVVMPELQFRLTDSAFYMLRNKTLWHAAASIAESGRLPDEVNLNIWLKQHGLLKDAGGTDYLGIVVCAAASPHNWPDYLEQVQLMQMARAIVGHCAHFSTRANNGITPAILDDFESETLALRQSLSQGRDLADIPAIQRELISEYQEALNNQVIPGIHTGFYDLDALLGGMKPQDLVIIAGSPSSGKTSLALNIVVQAIQNGIKSGIVSLETSAKKLVHRSNCIMAQVDGASLLSGRTTNGELSKVVSAASAMKRFSQHVQLFDRGGLSAPQVAAVFRRMYQRGARLFVLDYLQLLSSGRNSSRRIEEMTLVSTMLKAMAKELNCPVIAVSSLNRMAATENRAPRLSDLRETGQIEFDADSVLLLHPLDDNDAARTVEVNVAKNKEGATGKCNLIFDPPQMRFESCSRISQQDIPQHHPD